MQRFIVSGLAVAFGLATASAGAAPLRVVEVAAPDVNCVFDTDCTITVDDLVGEVAVPAARGEGRLQSRTKPPGERGTRGAGLYPYEYRVDLTPVAGITAIVCVDELRVPFGPVETLDYDADGRDDQVYVVTRGGLGSVRPSSADSSGGIVTFRFSPPVCAGSRPGGGETSFFFGLASRHAPRDIEATVGFNSGPDITTGARAPGRGGARRAGARPTILSLAESESFVGTPETGPVLLHLSHEEVVDAMRHGELQPGRAPAGPGFDVIPLPGGGGNLVIPFCGPCEIPRLSGGNWRCDPLQTRECVGVPHIPEPEPQPAAQCQWQSAVGRFGGCQGACPRRSKCNPKWFLGDVALSMRCICEGS